MTETQTKPTYLEVKMLDEWTGRNGEPQKNWLKLGVAFPTKDGGFTLDLKAYPCGPARIVAFPPKAKQEA